MDGNETFSIRLISSVSLLWLIWRENANMSNVKEGKNPSRLKHKGFRWNIAYLIVNYVTASKILTNGEIDDKNITTFKHIYLIYEYKIRKYMFYSYLV